MSNCFKKHYLVLLGILFLAAFLRFYKISSNPPGLYVDEAAIGYNAYSILKTGKDEYGKFMPLFFRSFGVYTMPFYVYLSAIPIKLFGLSVFSVRFPSAFFGSISSVVIYFLSKQMFPNKQKYFYLIPVLVYAITPWSIFFSRGAYEANLALFFLLAAIFTQTVSFIKEKPFLLILSSIFYAVSSYTYQTERFLSPIFLVLFSLYLWDFKQKNVISFIKTVLPSFLLFLLIFLPQILLVNSGAGRSRLNSLSIDDNKLRSVALYSAYFSPRNLFFDPDPDRQRSYPDLSVFYPWMAVFYFFGIYCLFLQKNGPTKKILIAFLILSPVPAAITRDPFSTLRSLPLMFPLILIISLGIEKIFLLIKVRFLTVIVSAILLIMSLVTFYRSAFILFPKERFSEWTYGFFQIADKINKGNFDTVLINDPQSNTYIELLFFLKYPPEKYQVQGSPINLSNYYFLSDWKGPISWDKYSVKPIYWREDIYKKQLIIAKPLDLSEEQAKEHFLTLDFVIIAPDGSIQYNGYLTDPIKKIKDDERKLKLIKL